MAEVEASAPYEVDVNYAPVGLGVVTFWSSALVVGLVAFAMAVATAKGYGPYLHENSRVFFVNDVNGLIDGIAITVILLVLSILMGLIGRAAVRRKASVAGLSKIAWFGIPTLMAVLTIASVAVNH